MFSIGKLKAANRQNVSYTVLCNFEQIAFSIILNLFSNTMVDLQHIYSVSIDTMAYLPVATNSGYMVGAMIGWTYKWLNRQLTVSIFLVVMSIAAALAPYYHIFSVFLAGIFISGLGSGVWIASSNAWLVEMWPTKNSALLQFFQFMYGCGAVISPLLVTPYVYGKIEIDERTNRTISVDDRVRSLTTPFAIGGVVGLIAPLILLILFFVRPYRKNGVKSNESNESNEANETNTTESEASPKTGKNRKHIPNRIAKLAICCLALSSFQAAEFGWFTFASTMFQNLPVAFSAPNAAHMIAIFFTAYTLGRLATSFVALKLSPDIIISYHLVTSSVAMFALYIGRDRSAIIYIANGFFGFGCSAMWSAMYAFAERHLRLTDRICSTFSVITGFVSLIIPLVLGQTFERHPLTLFALEGLFIAICATSFITVRLWFWFDRSK